jgi:hypothetical protein
MINLPVTPRAGRPGADGLRDALTPVLRQALADWVRKYLFNPSPERHGRVLSAAIALDLTTTVNDLSTLEAAVEKHMSTGDEELLDGVHVTLGVLRQGRTRYRDPVHHELEQLLAYGRSVWAATEAGLVRRVDSVTSSAFDHASANPDSASVELAEAWDCAHRREPNPSDAWDHAIKAVELILIPIVVPNQDKPQLGHVIGQLTRQGHMYSLRLGEHGVEPLVGMLRLIWPNPDRHGNAEQRRPTPEEARAVVHLAVTIVQWGRAGLLARE